MTKSAFEMTRAEREIQEMRRAVAIGKLIVLKEEAWRLAALVNDGVIGKIVAVDALQEVAGANNLVDQLGQDYVQALLADAFGAEHLAAEIAA